MNSITISTAHIPLIIYKSLPVITTETLANAYKTQTVRIRQNYRRNADRFIEGKHYFKVMGHELRDFESSQKIPSISNKARSLMLWTERGAARHAKMLETNEAWDVFEKLEDAYFSQKVDVPIDIEPPPAPSNTRNYAYALEHIAYLRDWSKQALDGRNRESFLASVRELEGSLRSGWTEMDEAMLHLTIGAALLRRWRDVH